MEQREHNAETKASRFVNEFSKKFRSINYTLHPSDIPGELAGKGSNMAWAARKLSERYSLGQRKDVIVTGIDGEFAPQKLPNVLGPVARMHRVARCGWSLYFCPVRAIGFANQVCHGCS